MDIEVLFFGVWAVAALAFLTGTIMFAVWERRMLANAERARLGSLIPEIYIVQDNFEEVLGRGYSERRS
jgi:hypothetical protein